VSDGIDLQPRKETKAQKVERLKLEKNPWEALEEIREFARRGRGSVLPEWANLYFKWWGIYTQGDGVGAVGGQGGEGKATEYFMMRIGLANGLVRSDQLRVIANLAERHARGIADITVRQNIQLHWLTISALRQSSVSTTGNAKSAFRSASEADCQPIPTWRCGSMHSCVPSRFCMLCARSSKFSAMRTCCVKIASVRA
jgi:hypothetical protein